MPSPDTPFADMSMWDKLTTLTNGGLLRAKHWTAGNEHGKYPEAALLRFKQATDKPRVNRNIVDRALNYGGGYDFGSHPDVPLQDAVEMAKAYQLWDYMTTFDPKREADAQLDYEENAAGVVRAKADQELGRHLSQKQRDKMVLDQIRQAYRQGGLVQMKRNK